jgi:hypothetical protein
VLLTALRDGASAVRRAGWPAYAVALLCALPDLMPSTGAAAPVEVALFPIVGLIRTVVFLALIRVLGAHRTEPVPPPPAVDASGIRTVSLSIAPQTGEGDRRLRPALRSAVLLSRPALRLFGLSLLGTTAAIVIWVVIVSGSGLELDDIGSRDPVGVVPIALLSALLLSFVALADQRVALEGDPRVLLAAAHSVRIASVSFAAVYALVLLASAPGVAGALLPQGVDGLPWQLTRITLGAGLQLLVLAALNEIYLAGPRADVLVDTGRPD